MLDSIPKIIRNLRNIEKFRKYIFVLFFENLVNFRYNL